MRILFNCMNLRKGGAERVISILANSFVKDNQVQIVTNVKNDIEYDFDYNIRIKSLEKYNKNNFLRKIQRILPFKLHNLKRNIIEFNPDIIISFLPEPTFRLLFLKKYNKLIKKIPVIISVRNDPDTEYKNPVIIIL